MEERSSSPTRCLNTSFRQQAQRLSVTVSSKIYRRVGLWNLSSTESHRGAAHEDETAIGSCRRERRAVPPIVQQCIALSLCGDR